MQIIAKLRQQGLSQEAAEELLSTRWSESGKANIATGWKQWHGYVQVANQSDTLPVAAAEQIDVLDPTPSQFVEFLRSIRKDFRHDGEKQNVSTGANWVRAVRSHVSTTCSLWLTQPIGAHPLVTAYITSLQNEDFFVLKKNGYRYDDT